MQIARPGLAGIDHGFELGGGQQPRGDGALGQIGHILGFGRRDRRHGGGFDEMRRVFARFGQDQARGPVIGIDPALLAHGRRLIENHIGDGLNLVGLWGADHDRACRPGLHRPEEAQLAGAGTAGGVGSRSEARGGMTGMAS